MIRFEDLIEKYLEEGELEEKEIVHGVKQGFAAARIAPVLCGAATKPVGVDRLGQFIVDEFPAPTERRSVTVTTKGGEEKERPADAGQPLTAFVFKTVSDPYVGHITMFRVFSGKHEAGPEGEGRGAPSTADLRGDGEPRPSPVRRRYTHAEVPPGG